MDNRLCTGKARGKMGDMRVVMNVPVSLDINYWNQVKFYERQFLHSTLQRVERGSATLRKWVVVFNTYLYTDSISLLPISWDIYWDLTENAFHIYVQIFLSSYSLTDFFFRLSHWPTLFPLFSPNRNTNVLSFDFVFYPTTLIRL